MAEQPNKSLGKLRAELDKVDQDLIGLFARRLSLIGEISAIKLQEKKALFDRSREREVIEKAAGRAVELGIEPAYARRLVEFLLEVSYQEQEKLAQNQPSAARSSRISKILIIGGQGKMGSLFGSAFSARGHSISVLERGQDLDSRVIENADVVIVSVPMEICAGIVKAVAPKVRRDALLCDFNSLKSEVCEAMQQYGNSEAIGMHPMFGPSVKSFRRQKVVICPVRAAQTTAWWREELGLMGFELLDSSPETHDQMMAIVQVMTHLGTMVMGEALRSSGVSIEKTLEFTSPIYRLELAMVGRLFAQDPSLYAEIALTNPLSPKIRKIFLESARNFVGLLDSGDRTAFIQQFRKINAHFDTFSSEAMKLSDRIIETITKEP